MAEHMLTTDDNPYDPFSDFDAWDEWDKAAGYHTSAFLARVVRTSDEISEADQNLAIESAIDEIVSYNLSGHHIKVERIAEAA